MFFEDFCPRHPDQIALIFRESAGQGEVVEAHRKKIFDKLTGDLMTALKSIADKLGPFRSPMAEEVMAASILGMFERLAYQYLIWQNRHADFDAVGRDAVAFILGGIRSLLRDDRPNSVHP